jgi:ribosomal-protein-alanine N-acetyltransferase
MIKESKNIEIINSFLSNFNTSINKLGVYSKYIVYYINDEEVGFLNYDIIYDRVEIEYIFVKEKDRRKNIASFLMNYLFEECNRHKCINITLEVRESNIIAINFYESQGFKKIAKRDKYYKNEDGILMMKEML